MIFGKRVDNQLIWYNSGIKIGGKVFFWEDVYEKGLRYVYQLFENRKFKSFRQVQEQYGLTVLRYNSLKAAIPKDWKIFFEENSRITFYPITPHNYDTYVSVYLKRFIAL